jgi:hypothetical protein
MARSNFAMTSYSVLNFTNFGSLVNPLWRLRINFQDAKGLMNCKTPTSFGSRPVLVTIDHLDSERIAYLNCNREKTYFVLQCGLSQVHLIDSFLNLNYEIQIWLDYSPDENQLLKLRNLNDRVQLVLIPIKDFDLAAVVGKLVGCGFKKIKLLAVIETCFFDPVYDFITFYNYYVKIKSDFPDLDIDTIALDQVTGGYAAEASQFCLAPSRANFESLLKGTNVFYYLFYKFLSFLRFYKK